MTVVANAVGVLAEDRLLHTGNGEGLRIADCVQNEVKGVAADITECAKTCGLVLDKGGTKRSRNAATASATRLDVVDITKLARLNDLLDRLHVGVEARLEADGKNLSALLLCLNDVNSLIERYAHGLLKQNVNACLKSVNGARSVLTVVGTNADAVELERLVGEHLNVVLIIGLNAFNAVLFKESLCLAGNEVAACNDLNVGLGLVSLNVSVCDPAGTDNTDTHFFRGVNGGNVLVFFKRIQVCHSEILQCVCFLFYFMKRITVLRTL